MNNIVLTIIVATFAVAIAVGAVFVIVKTISQNTEDEIKGAVDEIHKAIGKLELLITEMHEEKR